MNREFTKRTLAEYLNHSLSAFGNNKAYSIINGESITFNEFGKRIESLINLYDENGIKIGAKIALLGGSMPNWPVAYMATTTSSRIIVPLLPDFTAFEIANILEHSGCKAIIISKRLIYKLSDAMREKLEYIICLDTLELLKVPADNNLENTDAKAPVTEKIERKTPKPEDIASIIYTSGTSGKSKGVILTHNNITSNLQMIYKLYPVDQNDVFLSILPLSHAYECTIGMLYPMTEGSSVYYLNGAPTPSLLMPALKKVRPSIMLSVPLIVEKIYKNKVRPMFTKNWPMQLIYSIGPIRRVLHMIAGKKLVEMFGGRLRFFGIGGAKLDGTVERFLLEAKFPYAIGYGLTECCPLLAGAIPSMVKWQTTGPAVPGVQLRIDNINPETGEGEIVAKGDNIMMGYYKNPQATAEAFTEDGWFRTQDLGFIDEKGWLSIRGRLKNMILGPSGENIYPEEIETVINSHPAIAESLVLSIKGKLIARVHPSPEKLESLNKTKEEIYKAYMAKKMELIKEYETKKAEIALAYLEKKATYENLKSEYSHAIEEKKAQYAKAYELKKSEYAEQYNNKRRELFKAYESKRDEAVAAYHRKKEEMSGNMNVYYEKLSKEVAQYVNSKVNKFSQIAEVYIQEEAFQKTATSKIKRYLYN